MTSPAPTRPVTDISGYEVRSEDLQVLGLTLGQLDECLDHEVPLGMTGEQFALFRKSLSRALAREGIGAADVRLQGSSARFFSGPHKQMAYQRERVYEHYLDERHAEPSSMELFRIVEALGKLWPDDNRPLQRPFDSYFRFEISPARSDYDVQISSDSAVNLLVDYLEAKDIDWAAFESENKHYKFIRKEVSEQLLYLEAWAAEWTKELGRTVSIALFPSRGPQPVNGVPFESSSQFKDTDWILYQTTDGDQG
jgi:hypothetical protein